MCWITKKYRLCTCPSYFLLSPPPTGPPPPPAPYTAPPPILPQLWLDVYVALPTLLFIIFATRILIDFGSAICCS